MNELPVIGSLCLRKDLWDCHGANIATRNKGMYGKGLFRYPKKKRFWGEIIAFFRCFKTNGGGNIDTRVAQGFV